MKFLEISEGRCCQDSLYIKKIEELPDFVIKRRQKNIVECVFLENHTILCFFADDTIKKISLENLKEAEDIEKIVSNEQVYQSGKVGTDGYFITFNDSLDIPSGILHDAGITIPLSMNEFKAFVQQNILDTTESCNMLECSRQNISYMVSQEQLVPIKEDVRGNLYLKGDVLRTMW